MDEMLLLRVAADFGERQNDDRETRRRFFRRWGRRGLRRRWLADFERIDADRLRDVLQLRLAEISDLEFDLPVGVSIRRSAGKPALRSTIPFCTSIAQRTASTTLRNSMRLPSPVRLTMRGDGRIYEIGTEATQARQGAILVRPRESAVTVRRFPHGAPFGRHSE
jgi:hypothetical protein